jgi:hypothetical protein
MMEMMRPFETSVLTRATFPHILEDGILHMKYSLMEVATLKLVEENIWTKEGCRDGRVEKAA